MNTELERLATLEERVRNIGIEVDKISQRVEEIYALVQRGKGAKWAIVAIAYIVGLISHKFAPGWF